MTSRHFECLWSHDAKMSQPEVDVSAARRGAGVSSEMAARSAPRTRNVTSNGQISGQRKKTAVIFTVTPNPGLDRTLTVPRIAFDEVLRATGSRVDWGGKGLNVSRALLALGFDSEAMGFLGGAAGVALERGIRVLGIATDFVHIAGETRTNTVITEPGGGRYVKANEDGPTVRADELASLLDRVREKAQQGDIWVLSGSLPPGAPPDLYARLITVIQQRGGRALLDSSGEPLRLGCAAKPYLVKPNAVEAEEMTGQAVRSDASARAAAQHFLNDGIELVALSLGAEGLLLASQQGTVWARTPTFQVQNPVGAGDALLSGIVWGLACRRQDSAPSGLNLEEIARCGVATGAAAAAREGVSFGTRAEVMEFYNRARVQRGKN